jgi:hypothetical protein
MIRVQELETRRNSLHGPSTRFFVLAALILVATISSAAPAGSIERIHSDVSWLADSARQGRRAGTQGAVDSANYIGDQFHDMGFEVQMQEFGGNRRNVVARLGTSSLTER